MIKRILSKRLFTVVAVSLVAVLALAGVAFAVSYYHLDKTIDSTVTITEGGGPPGPTYYTLTVVANPVDGGVVTGGGSFVAGTYPVTGTANEGYIFTGWTGAVVDPSDPTTDVVLSADTTVTANFAPITEVTLYTDALCTTPIPADYIHNFGSVTEGGTPQNPLWFKADEITPESVNVVAVGLPEGATLGFLVGTPMNAIEGKPTTLALWLSGVPVGTYDFDMTVTGQNY